MELVRTERGAARTPYSDELDWAWWELSHNGGAHARNGAAMLSPDHTWWQGLYETARVFYTSFAPALRAHGTKRAVAYFDSVLQHDPLHAWLSEDPEKLRAQALDSISSALLEHEARTGAGR